MYTYTAYLSPTVYIHHYKYNWPKNTKNYLCRMSTSLKAKWFENFKQNFSDIIFFGFLDIQWIKENFTGMRQPSLLGTQLSVCISQNSLLK